MKTVALLSNQRKDKDFIVARKVFEIIKEKFDVISSADLKIDGIKYVTEAELLNLAEAVIVLGGDGTIIRTSRMVCKKNIPILGINMGHLGFLAEIEKTNLEKYLNKFIEGKYTFEKRCMLYASVERNGQKIAKFNALNDVVISCTSFKRMVDLELFVDNVKINEYSADGVILSTPTGSTAYSLSAGGPVIDSSLNVTVITPICPHLLAVRPVIVPSEKTIKVRIKEKTNRHSMLTIDGQEGFDLEHNDVIKVTSSNYKTTLIKISDKSFYDVLKYKLSEKPKKKDF